MENPNFNIDTQFVADTMNPVANISPIQQMATDIRQKVSQPDIYQSLSTTNGLFSQNSFAPEKRALKGFANETFDQAYDQLSSGEYVSRFQDFGFIPNTDNMERSANLQTTGDKWANGMQKFLLKTGNAVIGGTAGIVNGLGVAIKDGDKASFYDNDFSNWLSDLDTKMNYNLPNYYTEQENNKGVFGQLGTANFWADKFLGGLSFTAGAIVSEGIWAYATGGTSLATAGARLGTKLAKTAKWGLGEVKTLEGLTKYKQLFKNLNKSDEALDLTGLPTRTANTFGKAGEFTSAVTFMGRSAGYEASVEALQFKKEAEESFFNNFKDLNGREPSEEETAEFYKDLNSSANGVFTANMAIVGASNLVTLGNILDIKNPINLGFNKFIDKKAFGYGIAKTVDDAGKASYGAIEATGKQKIARNIFGYGIKPAVTEGLFEEGLQGVTNKTANKWLEHTYNPKYTTESFHLIDAMGDSLAEQYGTEEGWKENMLGILIGIAGGTINTTAENKQKEKELEFESAVANKFQAETIQSLLLPNRIQQANRIAGFSEQAKEEAQKGNITKSALAQSSATLTYINAKQVLGESNENIVAEVGEALNKVTEEQFREAGIENSQEYKKEVLQEFSELAEQWKTNKTYWKYMIGQKLVGEDSLEATALEDGIGSNFSKTAGVVEALAWQTTIGERAMKMMGEAKTVIAREVGKEYADAVELSDKLKRQANNRRGQVTKLTSQYNQLEKERTELTQKIALLDGRPTTPDGDKAGLSPRVAMTARLQQLSAKIEEVNGQLNTIAEELSKADTYAKGIETTEAEVLEQSLITGQDLLELEEKLQKFKGILDTINPQRKQYLEDILSEYIDAEEVFTDSQVTQQILLRPDFKLKNIGSWLGGKLGSKVMEEDSKEWLQNALNAYAKAKVSSADAQLQQEQTAVEEVVDNTVAKPKAEEVVDETIMSPVEKYKKRIETALKTYDLTYLGENYDGVTNNIPTKEEIEEFQTVKKGTKRYNELYSKLSNWKLLDSIVDIENNSIVEIVKLIESLEQEVQENNTKDEITVDETISDLNQENSKEYGSSYQPDLGVNVLANATVKKANGFYEITHVKPSHIVRGLNEPFTIKRGTKLIDANKIDELDAGDIITVGEVVLTILPGQRIQIKQSDFTFDRQQQLNMFIRDTETVKWTFLDIYERKEEDGRERKMQSQFNENITPEKSYELKKGDKVTLHIKDTDGWNKTKKGSTIDNLKIFVRDSKGNDVQTLKAGKGEKTTDPRFLDIRQEAFRKWDMAGRPKELDLGIELTVDMVLFGSAELIIRNGFIQDTEVSQKAIKDGIVIAKGYIENGEIKIDKELGEVSKAYVGRLSEKNPDKKIPIIVFKKGVYNIAFPISMNKFENPVDFDSLLTGTLQEQVLKINQAIIENNIKDENNQTIERLVYSDILDQEKIDGVRKAFVNNKNFVTAETLLNPNYKIENLTRDARIRIDLEDLGNVVNSPKIRFSFENIVFSKDVDSKNENLAGLEKRLSDLALEVYRDFTTNAQTKYVDSKGLIIEDTAFSQAFSDNEVVVSNSNIKDRENLNVLKEAFSETPSSIIVKALGAQKVAEIQELLRRYDTIKSQIVPKDNLLKDGQNNICN